MSRTVRILILECENKLIRKVRTKGSWARAQIGACLNQRPCISSAPILSAPPILIVGTGVFFDSNKIRSKINNPPIGIP